MRTSQLIHAVDSHTEGMPTRVVVGGIAPIPGSTMSDRRDWAKKNLDDVRGRLMREPHGHAAMSGAILQPPTRPDADWGVLYIETTGFLPICGHGTIGVATVLVETGLVGVTEPMTTIRLDTPAGLVEVEVEVDDGRATQVTLTNVPAFVLAVDQEIDVPTIGPVSYDMVYGGNFYPVVDAAAVGLELDRRNANGFLDIGRRLVAAVNLERPPEHPLNGAISGIHHVQFTGPATRTSDTTLEGLSAVYTEPGYFDRSPCGTGTSARLALLHARGELDIGQTFVSRSLIGTRFKGEVIETTTVGSTPAIVPRLSGRAWLTGFSQHLLDPSDPFPAGFTF
jgi:proline racemase